MVLQIKRSMFFFFSADSVILVVARLDALNIFDKEEVNHGFDKILKFNNRKFNESLLNTQNQFFYRLLTFISNPWVPQQRKIKLHSCPFGIIK